MMWSMDLGFAIATAIGERQGEDRIDTGGGRVMEDGRARFDTFMSMARYNVQTWREHGRLLGRWLSIYVFYCILFCSVWVCSVLFCFVLFRCPRARGGQISQ